MSKDELFLFRRQQIEDYRNSGQSAETWCEVNTMKVSTLRYWLRRIKDADQPEPEQAWATMKLIDKATSVDSTPIIIRVNNFEISLQRGFEPTVLSAVIQTLQGI
ncbi:hypothetical protein DSECCO2_147560 [anaerobic digester metagenome]|jgi:hypothetical protein|uniref:IS66 family insertion sequence element accessory protein TnpA n=1 Tax=Acetobacterium sp. UBA5834 TaxID=1945907 RepID=UPI00257E2C9B|nr:hypothetical protein [Acetobacterium sp. UBA5834]